MVKLSLWPKSPKARIFLAVFGFFLILAVMSIIFWPHRPADLTNGRNLGALSLNQPSINMEKDSDGDGLKDWEETLYRTDSNNPDTDGDGTSDGEEIKQNRDPLKPGPDDYITTAKSATETSEPSNGDNFTRNFTRIFTENYFKTKGAGFGGKVDPQEISQETLFSFLSDPAASSVSFPTVDPNELKISTDNSPAAVKNYFNKIALIFEKNLPSTMADPALLFASVIKMTNPESQLYRFNPYISGYEGTIAEIKKTPVPSSWKNFIENYLNSLLKMNEIVKAFRHSDKDIIKAVVIGDYYLETVRDIQRLYQEMKSRLQKEGIVFGPEEPAKKFLKL